MSKKLIMFNYIMNLTEISRSQILDNLFPQKNYHHNGWNAFGDASQGNIVVTLI